MTEGDYVLGTRDDEVERLGLQHRVWRERVLDAWTRAGIGPGQTVIDVGAGPGFAARDLARIVGPHGKVIALERAPHFLKVIRESAEREGLGNIEVRDQDVSSEGGFGEGVADASWCRWLLSFVADPRRTVGHIARALKPGGVAVFHEYGDYGAWKTIPPDPDVERFRSLVSQSWRDSGGEPDIAPFLPDWLEAEGMNVEQIRPLIDIVDRKSPAWQWPASFMATGARRLHELGYVGDEEEARRLGRALETTGARYMVTPLVVEIIARKP
ncbi:MAG TPA: methyltransferase domain-containing protein [Allosphingosinicella sp.]